MFAPRNTFALKDLWVLSLVWVKYLADGRLDCQLISFLVISCQYEHFTVILNVQTKVGCQHYSRAVAGSGTGFVYRVEATSGHTARGRRCTSDTI